MFFKDEQSEKAPPPIEITFSGITKFVMEEHPAKASPLMDVIPSGIVISFNEEQLEYL